MEIVAIAAVASNGVLGDGKSQPFRIKADFARFKRVTMGHPMLMGRATFDVMGLLPGRVSVVVTRHPDALDLPPATGDARAVAVGSVEEGLREAQRIAREAGKEAVFIVGGGEIYAATLDVCTVLDITEVHATAEGDVVFPEIDPTVWCEVSREPQTGSGLEFDFVRYERCAG